VRASLTRGLTFNEGVSHLTWGTFSDEREEKGWKVVADTVGQNGRRPCFSSVPSQEVGESRDLREYPIRKGQSTAAAPLVGAGITETLIGVLARHTQTDYDKPGLMFWRYFAGILPPAVARKPVDDH